MAYNRTPASVLDDHPTRESHRLLSTTRDAITSSDLQQLIDGESFAVRITDFLDDATLAGLRDRFVGRTDHGPLATDDRFRRLGRAFSETKDGPDRESYFQDAPALLRQIRDIAGPHRHAADTMRILLDETWPAGAVLLRHRGRQFFAGVVRYQQGGVDLEPHTDNVNRNLPDDMRFVVTRQLSVNVYLDVPDSGGELEIWDEYPAEDSYRLRTAGRTYGVPRDSVGAPALVVHPRPGEAIFIDPRRLHAVAPSADRPRVTVGLFIGVSAPSTPLAVWS